MWLFLLHNDTKLIFISTPDELSVILFGLLPHNMIILNIVVGLDEHLLNIAYLLYIENEALNPHPLPVRQATNSLQTFINAHEVTKLEPAAFAN